MYNTCIPFSPAHGCTHLFTMFSQSPLSSPFSPFQCSSVSLSSFFFHYPSFSLWVTMYIIAMTVRGENANFRYRIWYNVFFLVQSMCWTCPYSFFHLIPTNYNLPQFYHPLLHHPLPQSLMSCLHLPQCSFLCYLLLHIFLCEALLQPLSCSIKLYVDTKEDMAGASCTCIHCHPLLNPWGCWG